MLKHYLKQAYLKLIKHKNLSTLNILGLSIGLSCSIILLLWIKKELNYESCFPNANQICQAYLKGTSKDEISYQTSTSPKIATLLKSNYPEILDATRLGRLDEMAVKSGDKIFIESDGGAADPNYFNIFNYSFISGNAATVLNNPFSIVITKSFSNKFFGDKNPIGNTLTLNNKYIFTVTGLIEDIPDNAYRKFDFMVPFDFLKELGYDIEGSDFFPCSYINYALLQKGTNIATLSTKTEHDIQAKNEFIKFEIVLKPLKETYLQETNGKTKAAILGAVAILILLLACINSVNLTTGQYLNNLKGIGLRIVIGANKFQLFKQTITESFLHAFISIIIALIFVKIGISLFNNLSNGSLNLNLFDPYVFVGLLGLLGVTTLMTGLFPALTVSSLDPVNVLKNNFNYKFSKRTIRTSLIVFQFAVTVFFIISVLTIKKQNNLVDSFHLGYEKNNIVYVRLNGDIKQNILVVKEELLKSPIIKSVTVASELPGNIYSGSYFEWGIDELKQIRICELKVDHDFIKTFNIQMATGRFFKEDNEINSIVLNQSAIKALNEHNPVEKTLKYRGKTYTLIGVLNDFQHGSPLDLDVSPMAFILKPNNNNNIFIKINSAGDNVFSGQEAMNFIKKTCDMHSTEWPLQYQYLDDFAPEAEKLFASRDKLVTFSTYFIILISCFGLLGFVILSASQKIKEIGIRRVNGAKVFEILAMLNRDFVKWVAIAFVIATPIAYYAMNKWLENFAYKTELSWWIFALAGLLALGIALLTVSWQSWRAATRNPVEALRSE